MQSQDMMQGIVFNVCVESIICNQTILITLLYFLREIPNAKPNH